MKKPLTRISITSKLSLLLLIFVLIFYGTLVHVFLQIQKMMTISEEIVSVNNVVAGQSKILIENLLEMDANVKKFEVLQKDVYREYFQTAKENFDTGLSRINHLAARKHKFPDSFVLFQQEYVEHLEAMEKYNGTASKSIPWVNESTLNTWLALIVHLRDDNQSRVEESLMQIHSLSLASTRNGLLGFGLSVFTAVFGVWFFSKAILSPLKRLAHGLRSLPQGDYESEIQFTSNDEFQDLAVAYNDMNRELKEAESLRVDFIATLSHEIRTPLSSVKESVDMMAEKVLGPVNEKQHKFLTIAGAEISRISDLLNQLMDVSMLEANPSSQLPSAINPKEVVLHCTSGLLSQAKKKNITFRHKFQTNLPLVSAVREEILQVLFNIIGNALKFSPADSEMRITVLKPEKSGYVLFEISDQGPGIPHEERSLIFNKYYRSKAVRNHMDGVGLGLYISKKIIQGLGGTITVTNNIGKGCSFKFTLPLA